MKDILLTTLSIIACLNIYAYAHTLPTPSETTTLSSTSDHHDALKPITFEVAANGIVEPAHAGLSGHSHPDDLESSLVISTETDHLSSRDPYYHHYKNNPFRAGGLRLGHGPVVQGDRLIASDYDQLSSRDPHHRHYKHNPFHAGGLRLGHGPVVQGDRPIISDDEPSDKFLVIPLTQNGKTSSLNLLTSEAVQPASDTPSIGSKGKEFTSKPASSKSPSLTTTSDGFPTTISPTIPRCLNILRPLRDLAERLVYIKEAPHHTLISACRFQSLNQTRYDDRHVEYMRELCWDLFETIQLEGRRRWERCVSKGEEKHHYNSDARKEGDPTYEQESGVDDFSFHAYQLTPGNVKEFIAEHPDLAPEDVEWLTHDTNSTDTTTSIPESKRSVSRVSKRGWLSDLLKSVFAAELDAAIKAIVDKGVEAIVVSEAQEHRQEAHAENETSNARNDSSHHDSTGVAHANNDLQSNRIYVHREWYPIRPANNHVNQPRDNVGLPFTSEDIDNYLEFVRETRRLSAEQHTRLKVAVERELKLNSGFLSMIGRTYNSQSKDLPDEGHDLHKRSGQPPRLEPKFVYPYQWNFPSDLGSNPAYVNLTIAWTKTATPEQKSYIRSQLLNVWLLRISDLCNLSQTWTKDLSEESQEIALKFKGLTLRKCKEIREGKRENSRVGEYWKKLKEEENSSKMHPTQDRPLDGTRPPTPDSTRPRPVDNTRPRTPDVTTPRNPDGVRQW